MPRQARTHAHFGRNAFVRALQLVMVDTIADLPNRTLGVFTFESHAYTHSTAQQKQGLSLAALLQTTCTPSGTLLLRSWLVRPLLSLAGIRARHDAVECLAKPGNASTVAGLRGGLRGIKNLCRILGNRIHKGIAESRDWRALLEVRSR